MLDDSSLKNDQIDEIVLVSGSTCSPQAQQLMKDFFGGKELSGDINSDLAVAYGAVVLSGIRGVLEVAESDFAKLIGELKTTQ